MNHSNRNQFEEVLDHIKTFFKKFYSNSLLFIKKLINKDYASQSKDISQAKAKQRKRNKKQVFSLNQLFSKGLFTFNVAYGVVKTTFVTIILFLCLLGFLGLGTGMGYFAALVSEEEPPSESDMSQAIGNVELISSLHYNDGQMISEVRTDLLRTIVTKDEISPYVIDGLVSTEDEYFYEHNGVVPKAVLRALLTEVTGLGSATGGSTITQQLVKQQILTNEVTFSRKANEILLALRLENYFDKDEIITAYLNVSPFGRNSNGGNVAGIEEAATGIFGVHANEVNLPQAAFLVGLPQNPYTYTPYTVYGEKKEDFSDGVNRMKTVLTRMFEEQKISEQEYNEAMQYDITQDFIPAQNSGQNSHNYLYQQVEKQTIEILMAQEAEKNGLTFEEVDADVELYNEYYFRNQNVLNTSGYKVTSTINKDIYNAMQEAVNEYGENIGPTFVDTYVNEETGETEEVIELAQSGSILLENETGKILGFIGGRDFSIDQNDHAFDTYRDPGSTNKPLAVYAPAIEMNLITPASRVPDSPIGDQATAYSGAPWNVTNIGEVVSNTLVTAREALYQSMNNPTGKLYLEMLERGMEPYKYMDMMNYTQIDDDKANAAFSLGAGRTSVAEQTTGFATFANQGDYVDYYLIEKIEDADGNIVYQHEAERRDVFSPETAYLTVDILRDVINLGFSSQIKNYINFSADIAMKTGTSEDNRDYWIIASTPTVTLSSWIGYNNAVEDHTFYDPYSTGAPSANNMRYWSLIANKIHAASPETLGTDQTFTRPEGIVEKEVVDETGTLPGKVTIPGTNTTISVDGKKKTELFKADNLPTAITYDFSPGASDKDLKQLYWDKQTQKVREAEEKKKKEAEQKKKQEEEKKKAEEKKKEEEQKKKEEEQKKKEEEEKRKKEEEEKKKEEANNN